MHKFSSKFGYTGPSGELGVAIPLPYDSSIDPLVTPVPCWLTYPDTAHPGGWVTGQVRSVRQASPGKADTFFRVRDFEVRGVVRV